MFSRARAGRGHMATRWVGGPLFVYCCKTGELNTAVCSESLEKMLCSRQQALERCKSKYSVACSSLNTPVWPAGRRFVTLARNLAGSSVFFGILGGDMDHDLDLHRRA